MVRSISLLFCVLGSAVCSFASYYEETFSAGSTVIVSNLVITNGYAVSSNSFTWYYDFSSSNDLNDFIIESGGSAAVTVSNGICTINDADDASYLALSNTRNVTDPGTYVIRMRVESSSVLENAKIILGQTLQHMTNYLSPSMMVTPREMPAGDTVTNTLESGYNTPLLS